MSRAGSRLTRRSRAGDGEVSAMIQVTILPRSGLKSRTRRTGPVSYGVAIYELVTMSRINGLHGHG
jgi:hypothetical protein